MEQSIHKILRTDHQKAEILFIPKETALESLQEKTGMNDIADSLGRNPLPDSYVIRLPDNMSSGTALAAQIESVVHQLQKLPGIDKIQIDSDWTKRLAALLSVLRMGLLFLAIILSIVVIVVTFNTIAGSDASRRDHPFMACRRQQGLHPTPLLLYGNFSGTFFRMFCPAID